MTLHHLPQVRVEAWHQAGDELAALYSWSGVWILFDRYVPPRESGLDIDTVVVISAPTLELQMAAGALLMESQDDFESLWAEINDEH